MVEGDENSYDSAIYTALYPKELVVPRQSCDKVVEAAKSMCGLSTLHNLSVRGLVDRDRRGDEEIDALRVDGILVADVAEVENLLCLPEALEIVAKLLRIVDAAKAKATAEAAVLAEMAKVIDQQALARGLAEIQFRLNGFGPKIRKSDAAILGLELETYMAGIDVAATVAKCRKIFEDAAATKDYGATLRLYNCKGVIAFVAKSLGIQKEVYFRMVLDILKTEPDGPVAKAMRRAIEGAPDSVVVTPAVVTESGSVAAPVS